MKLSTDYVLTTHTGSLPRPDPLLSLLAKHADGEPHDEAALAAATTQAIGDVVARQVELGLHVVSDGELGKPGYANYINERLTGFAVEDESEPPRIFRDLKDFPDLARKLNAMRGPRIGKRYKCVGPITYKNRAPLERDIANFKAALARTQATEAFLNAVSPGTAAHFQRNTYYPSHEKYIEALAEALAVEYRAIVDAGFLLQVDCPDLGGLHDVGDEEFKRRSALHIEALNAALAGIPPEKVRMHVCWGNYEGPHDYDPPLADIVHGLLKARAQGLSIEGANPRHGHEWVVWRDVVKLPDDKVLIIGAIDTRTNYVEHPDLVAQRIGRWGRECGRERVIAGTDCGFATFAGGGKLDPGVSYKKLGALVQGAEIASRKTRNKK